MRRIAFVFLLLCLAACARRMPSGPSWCAAEPPAGTAAIAEDAVALLAATYPPGHTSIHLEPAQAGQDENAFAAALESGLVTGWQFGQDRPGEPLNNLAGGGDLLAQ